MKLITDRTQQNVMRRDALSQKGWQRMTAAERIEWSGDPLSIPQANLIPYGPYYSSVVELSYRNEEIAAKSTTSGIYLYAVSIVGKASLYENKTFTLSIDSIVTSADCLPQIAAYWHDGNGFEFAGGALYSAGSVTFNTADFPNIGGRENLALYIYVTTSTPVASGVEVSFGGVMLNVGSARKPYTPFSEIAETDATKGAYNYSDLNRVERAVDEISKLAGLSLVTKTNWTMWDVPTSSDMDRYLNNIKSIRNFFSIAQNIPATMNNLTYIDANNIEAVLLSAYEKAKEI